MRTQSTTDIHGDLDENGVRRARRRALQTPRGVSAGCRSQAPSDDIKDWVLGDCQCGEPSVIVKGVARRGSLMILLPPTSRSLVGVSPRSAGNDSERSGGPKLAHR